MKTECDPNFMVNRKGVSTLNSDYYYMLIKMSREYPDGYRTTRFSISKEIFKNARFDLCITNDVDERYISGTFRKLDDNTIAIKDGVVIINSFREDNDVYSFDEEFRFSDDMVCISTYYPEIHDLNVTEIFSNDKRFSNSYNKKKILKLERK